MIVFVAMPFNPSFDDIYEIIKSAADENKLTPYRVDKDPNTNGTLIIEAIEKGIKECVIFVADITGNNPNVMNEIGQARAHKKRIILISQNSPENASFDVKGLRINKYSKDKLDDLFEMLHEALSFPNQSLQTMIVPNSLTEHGQRKFVIAISPLRRAMGKLGGYKKFRNTASDYVGLRGILQAFGLLYGFQTLPDIMDPENCMDTIFEEPMTIYCVASPKANWWTGQLLEKFSEKWIPKIDFKADPISTDLRNVKISIYKNDILLYPDAWRLNDDLDRYKQDFGIIVRGPNPYHEDDMITVIAGRSNLGTEAASRAFTDPEKIDEISRRLSGVERILEDHKQAFWALVSMKRMLGDDREEAIISTLKVEQVGIFSRR